MPEKETEEVPRNQQFRTDPHFPRRERRDFHLLKNNGPTPSKGKDRARPRNLVPGIKKKGEKEEEGGFSFSTELKGGLCARNKRSFLPPPVKPTQACIGKKMRL